MPIEWVNGTENRCVEVFGEGSSCEEWSGLGHRSLSMAPA